MTATALSICNSALLLCNADVINSFDDETREAQLCSFLYATTRDALLSKHPWSFSIFQETLALTTTTPKFDFEFEFQLPTDYIRILKTDGLANDYRILKDKLFTNADAIQVLFQKDPGEEFYPAYFVRVVELRLAELLQLALVQDQALSQLFGQSYIQAMREARGTDSQNSPNLLISPAEFSLTRVRVEGS